MGKEAAPAAGLALRERLAADVFAKSYREFEEIRNTHYKWKVLAPESVATLERAVAQRWSAEKAAEHLDVGADQAGMLLRRFIMSQKANSMPDAAGRIKEGISQWLTRFGDMGEGEREGHARELALLLANHLYQAARSGEQALALSLRLEALAKGEDAAPNAPGPENTRSEEPRRWGPEWKD